MEREISSVNMVLGFSTKNVGTKKKVPDPLELLVRTGILSFKVLKALKEPDFLASALIAIIILLALAIIGFSLNVAITIIFELRDWHTLEDPHVLKLCRYVILGPDRTISFSLKQRVFGWTLFYFFFPAILGGLFFIYISKKLDKWMIARGYLNPKKPEIRK